MTFLQRRLILTATTLTVLVGITWWLHAQERQLLRATFTSGYVLLGAVLFLAAFQLRKKLAFLPLGRAAWWMQAHIYTGWGSCWLFYLHTSGRWPHGVLEVTLYGLFVLTAASGIGGLWMTRAYPRRLTKLREDYIYDRIDGLREQVRRQAEDVVRRLAEQHPAPIVAGFYEQRLAVFFGHRRGVWYAMRPSSRTRNRLLAEMDDLDRYFSSAERTASLELRRLVDRRDDLDYHQALQGHLKLWLFLHIALTYCLLCCSTLHVALAHAFHGGLP